MATSHRCSSADPSVVRAAVERDGIAVFERDDVEPLALEHFAGQLGPLVFTPGERPLPGTDYVFEVSNVGRTRPPRSVWHTDTSYVEAPPIFTMLASVSVPGSGGDTLVLDQRTAAATAEPDLLDALADVEFLHVASRVSEPDEAGAGAWHPVLRHVGEGGTALYVGARERLAAARRRGIPLDAAEAAELIDAVHDHAVSGEPTRHRWAAGDVIVIDNRTTVHTADHAAVVGDRVLHRVMCGTERPIPAR